MEMEMFFRFRERAQQGDVMFSNDVVKGVVQEVEQLLSDAVVLASAVEDKVEKMPSKKKTTAKTTAKKTTAKKTASARG